MIFCTKLTTVLVIAITLVGQAKSQGDWVTSGVVNGPTGISVEANEERQFSRGPPSFVNGPTAFSVEAEAQRNDGSLYQEVEENLQNTDDDGNVRFVESDVDLASLSGDDEAKQLVNGPSGTSVQQQEQMAINRGRISTDPKNQETKKQIPKGYHMDTTDWSTDSPHWTFKAGEWEMITLPDKEKHPNLPSPEIPGPALVVVTEEHLKKVYVSRDVEGLDKVTLHYRYYLSEGAYPNGIPELKVYQVKDELHTHMLAFETTFGRWSDNTIEIPETDTKFKILFEARLNKLGNEIAIDDITISGISSDDNGFNSTIKPGEIAFTSKNPNDPPLTPESVTENAEEKATEGSGESEQGEIGTTKPEDSNKTTKESQGTEGAGNNEEVETVNPGNSTNITKRPEETGILQNVTDVSLQGNDNIDMVNGAGSPVHSNETNITVIAENDEQGNETFSNAESTQIAAQGNDTFKVTETPQYTLQKGEEVTEYNVANVTGLVDNATIPVDSYGGSPNNETGITELVEHTTVNAGVHGTTDNSTEVPSANQTDSINITTEGRASVGINVTQIENSTMPTNITIIPEYNITSGPTNGTLSPGAVTTVLPISNNQTGPVVTPYIVNITVTPVNNSTGGGINATNIITTVGTTPEITNILGNATTDQGTNNTATASPIIINSTSPSGYNGTTPGNYTGAGGIIQNSSSRSWGAFKVFLVICLLGVVILGFLYWRRQRRRDDEIPVFSRASHADYQNPTFSDDDSNFASRGTAHNYKSFN